MTKRLFIGVFLLLGILACATTNLPPVRELPSLQLQEDERRLWNRSAEEQKRLENSLYDDPVLTAYLNDVTQDLIPEDIRGKGLSFQVNIIKNPLLNAFAYPNGVIYVNTGILSKMENEAQLATLLSHEMAHVTHRHAIENFRTVKNTSAVLATVQVAAIPFGVYGSLTSLLGSIGAMAAVTGYSRELETEADREGLELMTEAGYDPQEAPKLFVYLKTDLEKRDVKEPFFFGTHPRLQERINNYKKFLKSDYSGRTGAKGDERFNELIAPLFLDNAMMDLDMGRFSSAQEGIEKYLRMNPASARGHFCFGEIYRQRGEKEDDQKAEEEYRQALSCDPSYPQTHKGLGIIYYKKGMKNKSIAEFEKYLQLLPNALDREYIKQYIKHPKTD